MPEILFQVLTADLAMAYAIVIAAGIARGFTGFVAGLVNVALLALLYGPVEAIGLMGLLGLVSSVMILWKTVDKVEWNEAIPLGVSIAAATPAGAALLLLTDPTVVKPAIGLLVAACGVALVAGWEYRGPRNARVAAAVGAVCGGVTGFTGSGGPLMVFYYLASSSPPAVQRANISVAALMLATLLVATLVLGDALGVETVLRAALLFPGTMLGTWIGMRLFEAAPQVIYRTVAQWALVVIGLAVIVI